MSDPRLAGYCVDHAEEVTGRLFEWLSIPSISAEVDHRDDVQRSAHWLVDACFDAGATTAEVWSTPGHPTVHAQWTGAPSGAPTVLVYGHHDVQPVDPLHEWNQPPFEPAIRDGACLARGAIDDKGQVLYHLEAIRATLAQRGSLPVTLKLVVEGEEEIGSPNFEQLLEQKRDELACDVVVVSDTSMISESIASTDVAMRGLVACTVTLTTATTDLHSGLFGGAVANPLHHLADLVAGLHDANRRVAIDGFYDAVADLTDLEAASLAAQPFDAAEFQRHGGGAPLEGEVGYSTLERVGSRPTAEVVGLHGGYSGEGIKTIVPASATAKFAFRLVPDQDPVAITELVTAWIRGRVAPGIRCDVVWHGGVAPARTPVDHWSFEALRRTITRVWGVEPLLTRVGGSGPEEALARILGAPVIFLGVGLPQDRIHAPNERMVMAQFWRGLCAAGELYDELATSSPGEN